MYGRGRAVYREPMMSRRPLIGRSMRTLMVREVEAQVVVLADQDGRVHLNALLPFGPLLLHRQWLCPVPMTDQQWLQWPSEWMKIESERDGDSNRSSAMSASLLTMSGGDQSTRLLVQYDPVHQRPLYRPLHRHQSSNLKRPSRHCISCISCSSSSCSINNSSNSSS